MVPVSEGAVMETGDRVLRSLDGEQMVSGDGKSGGSG